MTVYNQAQAARRRIALRASGGGPVGRKYLELANTLMTAPDSPLRTAALKKLADSCDNAIALLEKTHQSQGNPPHSRRSPGQTKS